MKTKLFILLVALFCGSEAYSQIKIGDNPQTIDGSSLLELESGTRALVVTRINTAQMNAMNPLQGAVIYNTDTQCLHYFNGTVWLNLCEDLGQSRTFTANAQVNPIPTIVISTTGDNLNFEVSQITGANIVDGTVNGANDIQFGSVTQANLAQNSVGRDQLVDNAITPAELDLSVVTLNTFTNDAGFAVGPIVSIASGNAITDSGGAFYDDSALQNGITANTTDIATNTANIATNTTNIAANTADIATNTSGLAAHIAADGDLDPANEIQNLEQVLTIGNAANNAITNLTDPVNPQDAATKFYVDNAISGAAPTVVSGDVPNSIISGTDGGALYVDPDDDVTNELTDIAFDPATNILSLTKPFSPGNSVDLSSLAVHTGTPQSIFFADPNGLPITPEDASSGNNGALFWDATSRFNTGALFVGLKKGVPSQTDSPWNATPRYPAKVVIAERLNNGIAYPLQIVNEVNNEGPTTNGSSAGILFSTELQGTFGKGALIYERNVIGAPGNFARGDFHFLQNPFATTANPNIANAVMSIKNNGNVIIAPDSRNLMPQPDQKLYVGGDMRLTERFFDETNDPGAPDQILSATATGTRWINAPAGGTTLVFDNTTISGDGSMLTPYTVANNGIATVKIQDGAITTVKILDANVTPTKIAPSVNNGQVLTTVGGVAVWDNLPPSGTTLVFDNTTISGDGSMLTPYTVANNGIATVKIQDGAITTVKILDANVTPTKIAPSVNNGQVLTTVGGVAVWDNLPITGGTNLSNTNLAQNTDLIRTYEITNVNQSLVFTGLGNVGVGNGANPPQQKFHVAGAIRSQGFLNSPGTEITPSYRFDGDTNTGMFNNAADELGFSVGGMTAFLLKESVANGLEVIANGSLELTEQLIDQNGNPGNVGDVLTATATGTVWKEPSVVAMGKANGAISISVNGVTVGGGGGINTVTLATPRPDANYIIQLTVVGDNRIYVTDQQAGSFTVEIRRNSDDSLIVANWFFTILDF